MSSTPPEEPESSRNWLELPQDVTAAIISRLGALEILTTAQHVCSTWRSICEDPSMWRSIDVVDTDNWDPDDVCTLAKQAVDRSSGGLVHISLDSYASDDDVIMYIADRPNCLKSVRLISAYNISNEGLSYMASKVPSLEELEISYCSFSKKVFEVFGRSCPLLRSFKLNCVGSRLGIRCDKEALAIAKSMPELRYLQIFGNRLTNDGLQAILNGCPHLEYLDLRQCFNVNLKGQLGKKCAERIKDLRGPHDAPDDYPYDTSEEVYPDYDFESDFEDYASGLSDFEFMYDQEHLMDMADFFEFDEVEFGGFLDL